MRRLVVSLVASCGLFVLAACSGGGYGFNGNGTNTNVSPDVIAFLVGGTTLGSNGAGGVNDAFLSPTGSSPVEISAVGLKGTGSTSVVIPDLVFTWAAQYVAGATYNKGATPGAPGTCGAIPVASGATITIGGTGVLGATVSAIIQGVPVTVVENGGESAASVAARLSAAINSNSVLQGLAVSAAVSGSVITLSARPATGGGSNYTLAVTSDATGNTIAASSGTLAGGQGNAPINSLLKQNPGGGGNYPGYSGVYTQLTSQPVVFPNTSPTYTETAATIYVGVPFFSATSFQQPSPATSGNYCLRVVATHPQTRKTGALIVVVSQSP